MRATSKITLSLLVLGVVCGLFTNIICQNATTSSSADEAKMMKKFQNFMVKHNKQYGSIDELSQRFEIFKENYKKAKAMSVKASNPEDSVKFGNSPFIDMTAEEFSKTYLNSMKPGEGVVTSAKKWVDEDEEKKMAEENGFLTPEGTTRNLQSISIPENWDWRNQGVVTSVKNQGSCGGCWSFCAAANIEGQYARKTGKLISFSEQQMLDCDYTNSGCAGGIMDTAFDYIKNAGGLMTYASYPFIGYQGYCQFNPSAAVAQVAGYIFAGTTDEETIKKMLYLVGPLAITMNASTLQLYQGGVFNVPYSECPYAPDHGVTLVGYGVTSSGQPFWTIKNSWGPYWGENGYFRIARGVGLCGINQYVITARLA